MASNIRPLRRRLRLTKGRLVGRMSQERQRLSFFIVIMFLVIFGLIVLAEVLFMEDGKNEIFYDDQTASDTVGASVGGGGWETPKPLLPMGANGGHVSDTDISRAKLKVSTYVYQYFKLHISQ